MTTPEQRLRDILLSEAEDLVPAGDGLLRIEQRLAARRSLRMKLVPAAAIAGVVVVASAVALSVSLRDDAALEQRARHATPAPSCTGVPCTPTPAPSPSPTPAAVNTSASGTPLWPVTTDAEAADWQALPEHAWGSDPVQVTQHLLDDYLKLPGRATNRVGDDPNEAIVEVSNGSRPVASVRLVRVGRDGAGPWSVTGAVSDHLSVTRPGDGDDVTSPLDITGRANDPDTSVHVRLMTDQLLGEGYAPAGRELPWTHSLTWTGPDWSVAALVANTFDGKGDLWAITITAVRRAEGASRGADRGSALVAVDQEHIVSVDARTGQQLRRLSYPAKGFVDQAPALGGDAVVWVRISPDNCTSSIIRAGLTSGTASVAVEGKAIGRSLPALSPDDRSLGWVERPCGGDAQTVLVRGPDGALSTRASTKDGVSDLDVRDDGYAVVWTESGVYVVPPGTTTVTSGTLLRSNACMLAAPAWDGEVVVAWQLCAASWSLARFTATGQLLSASADVPDMSRPIHTAVTAGLVLVSLDDGRLPRFLDGVLVDTPNARRWGQADW